MISEADKGWFAAILDLKGHIVKREKRASGSEQITLYVDSSVMEITSKMAAMTGTNPEPRNQPDLPRDWLARGCIEHCPEAHVHHFREVNLPETIKWSTSGAAAAIVLWNLRDYLLTDREPWDWGMAACFASTRLSGRGAHATIGAIRRMHSLGWEMPPLFRDVIPKELAAPVREAS